MKIRLVEDPSQASRYLVAGLLVILAALLWVLAHPIDGRYPPGRPSKPPVHWRPSK